MSVPCGAGPDENHRHDDLLSMDGDVPAVRASDGDRDSVVAVLQGAVGDGRLTLQEFSERLDLAYAARTRPALAQVTGDLAGTHRVGTGRRRRVMLGILFDSRRAGSQPLDDEITAIALLGDVVIDLREAEVTSDQVMIRAYALLNDVDIIVPEGAAVELSGVAIVGDNRNTVKPVPAGAGRFVVKVDGHALLGDVQVLHRNPRTAGARRKRAIER